jgi:hypothetical protein
MILRHFHIFAHSSAHTLRTSTCSAPRSGVQTPARLRTARHVGLLLALLFALVLGSLPADARLVLRRADSLLSPLDTVRLSVVAQRTEYPSDDPADPRPFVVIDFSYPDLSAYTVGTDGTALTAPLDFSATVENRADIALRWCGLTHECTLLSARGESETRRARLTPDVPRLPLELEGHFADSTYGHAVALLTLTPTPAASTRTVSADAPTRYVIRFTYAAPSALPRIASPLAPTTPLYDLAGRRVVRPLPGHIYLRAGRKFVAE